MILFYLFGTILSESNSDLYPPFVLDANQEINSWSLHGSAIVNFDKLVLLPAVQHKMGSIWSNIDVTGIPFEIVYKLSISDVVQNASFAFWFISEFAVDGLFFGGPKSFTGFSIPVKLKSVDDTRYSLDFHMIVNDGETEYDQETIDRSKITSITLQQEQPIFVKIKVSKGYMNLYAYQKESKSSKIYSTKLENALADKYIGLSAISDRHTANIQVEHVRLDVVKKTKKIVNRIVPKRSFKTDYAVHFVGEFRNTLLNVTRREHDNLHMGRELSSSRDTIFDIIEEINMVGWQVATFKDVNHLLKETVTPFADKWLRRSIKALDRIKAASDAIGASNQFIEDIAFGLRDELNAKLDKTKGKVIKMAEILAKESDLDPDGDLLAIGSKSAQGFARYTQILVVVEIVALVGLISFSSWFRPGST